MSDIQGRMKSTPKLQGHIKFGNVYPELEDLVVTPNEEEQNFKSDKYGYNEVKVKAIETEEKTATVDFSNSDTVEVNNTSGKYIKKVTINKDEDLVASNVKQGANIYGIKGNVIELVGQTKQANPAITDQTIIPDEGYNALTSVDIARVTSDIDSNIQAENIKKDVSILNIVGTYTGERDTIKVFKTVEDMHNSTDNQEGDLAIVYTNNTEQNTITKNDTFRYLYLTENVDLASANKLVVVFNGITYILPKLPANGTNFTNEHYAIFILENSSFQLLSFVGFDPDTMRIVNNNGVSGFFGIVDLNGNQVANARVKFWSSDGTTAWSLDSWQPSSSSYQYYRSAENADKFIYCTEDMYYGSAIGYTGNFTLTDTILFESSKKQNRKYNFTSQITGNTYKAILASSYLTISNGNTILAKWTSEDGVLYSLETPSNKVLNFNDLVKLESVDLDIELFFKVIENNTYNGLYRYMGGSWLIDNSQMNLIDPNKLVAGNVAFGFNGTVTGTMPNNGTLNYGMSKSMQIIPRGYTEGGTIEAYAITQEEYDIMQEEYAIMQEEYETNVKLSKLILTGYAYDYTRTNLRMDLSCLQNTSSGLSTSTSTWYDLTGNGYNGSAVKTGYSWANGLVCSGGYFKTGNISTYTGTFEIVVKIPTTFTPVANNNWFNCSCILGCELPSIQRDSGIIIDRNGYFAIGYGEASIKSTNIKANDGAVHHLVLTYNGSVYNLYIDNVLRATVSYTASGGTPTAYGIMWNNNVAGSAVNGTVYTVRYYNVVLDTTKIAANYNYSKERFVS